MFPECFPFGTTFHAPHTQPDCEVHVTMQMQKKVTTKEDGRFLVYYHFPDTATAEETQVFEGIEEEKEKRRKGEEETQSTIANSSTLNLEETHV